MGSAFQQGNINIHADNHNSGGSDANGGTSGAGGDGGDGIIILEYTTP